MHESLVQEASLVSGHAAILAGLTVEDEVGCQDGTSDNGGAVNQLLREVSGLRIEGRLLHVCSAEGILKGLTRLVEDRGLSSERLSCLSGLEWRVVDEASGV